LVFDFGQKKMSKNEILRKVLKKGLQIGGCDHNALKNKQRVKKSVTITFFYFSKNNLDIFLE